MRKLLDQRSAIKLLQGEGWRRTVGGKHAVKMVKDGYPPVTLPGHRGQAYSYGLTHAILKHSGLNEKDGRWSSRSSYVTKARASGRRSESSRDASRQLER